VVVGLGLTCSGRSACSAVCHQKSGGALFADRDEDPLVALRFTNPVERVIRETDLPAEIRLPRRGKLVVKRFVQKGIVIGEVRTSGVMVEAELYERRHPQHPSQL
jgi:hypothetical protein